MNILEKVKEILTEYPKMSEFCNGIHTDFTENKPGNFGLYPNGDAVLKTDILGGQKRKHSFVLYANNQSFNDFERIANSTFLLELAYWLETVKNVPITVTVGNEEREGIITKMSSANGMMFAAPTGDITAGVTHQLQISAEYKVKG